MENKGNMENKTNEMEERSVRQVSGRSTKMGGRKLSEILIKMKQLKEKKKERKEGKGEIKHSKKLNPGRYMKDKLKESK